MHRLEPAWAMNKENYFITVLRLSMITCTNYISGRVVGGGGGVVGVGVGGGGGGFSSKGWPDWPVALIFWL